jgi:hypothetical protein
MQTRFAFVHGLARFGPDFCFHTAAADCARSLTILKEKHFRATSLWGRAASVRNRGHHDALAARVRVTNQAIEIVLSNRTHLNQ